MVKDPRIHSPDAWGSRLATYTVISPVAPLHRKSSARSPLETQLLVGERFDVFEIKGRWAWGQAISPIRGSRIKGYVGYVNLKYLAALKMRSTHVISALKAPVFSRADIKSHIIEFLPMGGHVTQRGQEGPMIQIGAGGFVHENHLRSVKELPETNDFVDITEMYLGLPYVWGGISTDGLDCSGLVLACLRAIGLDGPRDTDLQEKALGDLIIPTGGLRGLKRGDLVFWKGHVGIMQTAGRMIHANAHHMMVASEPLKAAARRISESSGPITSIKRLNLTAA